MRNEIKHDPRLTIYDSIPLIPSPILSLLPESFILVFIKRLRELHLNHN